MVIFYLNNFIKQGVDGLKNQKNNFCPSRKKDAERNSQYLNDNGSYSKPFPITTLKYEDFKSLNVSKMILIILL